jgi:adenylate kinase family enzyme
VKRVSILGCGGAGKSTLARKIGELINIPVIHLDTVFWKAGWIMTPKDEQAPIMEGLVKRESWVIDGNYTGTVDMRFSRSDTIIYMDFPRRLCFWRVFKRIFMYRKKRRPDITEGCPEKIDLEFLQWIWNYNKSIKPRIMDMIEQYKNNADIIILRNPEDVTSFIKSLSQTNHSIDKKTD